MKLTKFFALIYLALLLTLQATNVGAQNRPATQNQNADEYVTDATITTKVKAALLAEPDLKSSEISVETYKGNVQLSGFVSSQAAIKRAVEITKQVKGVQKVTNDMRLR